MGAGIAQVLLEKGVAVTVVETTPELAEAALGRVGDGLRRRQRSHPEALDVDRALSLLDVSVGMPERSGAALVIEAVPEDIGLKRRVLAAADAAFPAAGIVATNTSSLPVTQLAQALARPGRCCGMHFFNPVPVSELVEIVVPEGTDSTTVTSAREWVERLGKQSIVVRDSPGFATSRLGLVIGLEAIRMVEEGVASVEDIDTGMVLGYKFPMGPLRLTDLVGLDVRLAIADHLRVELGERFAPPDLLRQKVASGELGKKSGQGFYTW